MDAMDVDELPSHEEIAALNKEMNECCTDQMWILRAGAMGDDNNNWRRLLTLVIRDLSEASSRTSLKDKIIQMNKAKGLVQSLNDDELKELQNGVRTCMSTGNWAELVVHPKLRRPFNRWLLSEHREAYKKPFVGCAADDFIDHLKKTEIEDKSNKRPLYAKAISVVQSSGTGKSRMLSEVGRRIFSLPVCLRGPNDPGYPPSDEEIVKYFDSLDKSNHYSISALVAIVCFVAAAHVTMLQRLEKQQSSDTSQLLSYWYQLMESPDSETSKNRDNRKQFFCEVVQQAISLKSKIPPDMLCSRDYSLGKSPKRNTPPHGYDPTEVTRKLYDHLAKEPTQKLMKFLSTLDPPQRLCVTYFDEAHELGQCYLILLRLLHCQGRTTNMWYVFIGMKSSLFYDCAPRPTNRSSMRLRAELLELLPPYIALGFDQQMIAKNRAPCVSSMGNFQTLKHLSQYGRPMWSVLLPEAEEGEMVNIASLKLTNGEVFDPADKDHVFAVLSQRLCLDPALAGSGALELADRSVAHHMRLLTGFSANGDICYKHSPSEPILVLGSLHLLYNQPTQHHLARVLSTLSGLCSAGLIEKGVPGELCARILILTARDFASPLLGDRGRDFLRPVGLLEFLDQLFCGNSWARGDRAKFEGAFRDVHVNFTHWIVTKDLIVTESSQLLANLWARGAALQCSFNQGSIDFLIPVYIGPIDVDQVFDPSRLSMVAGQVTFKADGATKAECDGIRPIDVPRDLHEPLPYLVLLMELGTEGEYNATRSKMKFTAADPVTDGQFAELTQKWIHDLNKLRAAQKQEPKPTKADIKNLQEAVQNSQKVVDSCNQYLISVRGASSDVYGILREARIEEEFATLLGVTMPAPSNQDRSTQQMRPLERLGDVSHHTAWMVQYAANVAEEDGVEHD